MILVVPIDAVVSTSVSVVSAASPTGVASTAVAASVLLPVWSVEYVRGCIGAQSVRLWHCGVVCAILYERFSLWALGAAKRLSKAPVWAVTELTFDLDELQVNVIAKRCEMVFHVGRDVGQTLTDVGARCFGVVALDARLDLVGFNDFDPFRVVPDDAVLAGDAVIRVVA